MGGVHSGGPATDCAVQGGEEEKGGAGCGAINGKGRRGISERDVKDRAGGRARDGTSWRRCRRNGDDQRLPGWKENLLAGAVVKSGLSGAFVTDPKGTATGASQTPAIDQVRVGSIGDQVRSFVLGKG